MSFAAFPATPFSVRTRVLGYSLLGFCAAMTLFGPQIAEFGLGLLGCPARSGFGATDCGGIYGVLAGRLAPWLGTAPPLDTGFLLLDRLWSLLALWAVLIVLSVLSDRSPEAIQRHELRLQSAHSAEQAREQQLRTDPSSDPQPSFEQAEPAGQTANRGSQLRERQAEQLRAQRAEQELLRAAENVAAERAQRAQQLGWVALVVLWWLLLGGLVAFCIAFGTPLLAASSADSLLDLIGCASRSAAAEGHCGSFGAFWAERTRPYFGLGPIGQLLAPLWLFTQFHDVLLVWLAVILLFAAGLGYRLSRIGWRRNR